MKPVTSALTAVPTRRLTPVILDALSVDDRHLSRVAGLSGVDVLWVAESVREAREVLDGIGPDVAVVDLAHPLHDPRAVLREIGQEGGDPFTVVVAAADAPGLLRIRRELDGDACLCRSSRIRELPKLLREIAEAWS